MSVIQSILEVYSMEISILNGLASFFLLTRATYGIENISTELHYRTSSSSEEKWKAIKIRKMLTHHLERVSELLNSDDTSRISYTISCNITSSTGRHDNSWIFPPMMISFYTDRCHFHQFYQYMWETT